jgi:5-formyltetrahydrofolate cyclo-ligase
MLPIYHRRQPEWKEPAVNGLREAKRALREEVLARREAIDATAREAMSKTILDRIAALDAFDAATTVLAYAGFGAELQTDGFMHTVLGRGKTLILPRVEGGALGLYAVQDLQRELVPGTWGIRQPDPQTCERVEPSRVDFVLAPGVAFDARGGRLGYGGGFYDRLLSGLHPRPALVAGAFEIQVVERVPVDETDVRVDEVVTERQGYRAQTRE